MTHNIEWDLYARVVVIILFTSLLVSRSSIVFVALHYLLPFFWYHSIALFNFVLFQIQIIWFFNEAHNKTLHSVTNGSVAWMSRISKLLNYSLAVNVTYVLNFWQICCSTATRLLLMWTVLKNNEDASFIIYYFT